MPVSRAPFGHMPDGTAVERITLSNGSGLSVSILTLGATLQAVHAPDRHGRHADITPGFPDVAGYLASTDYFGATVGRVANRIAGGRFVLDGQHYELRLNNGPNSLHGGRQGFDRRVWTVEALSDGDAPSLTLGLVSPHLDQGYPGTLSVSARFALEGNSLTLHYSATTDRPTVVNLTNHAYWNLAGDGAAEDAMGHLLTIPAHHMLPTDATAIPTGEFRPVDGTPFDFRSPTPIGARIRDAADPQIRIGRGYDHNMVISRRPAAEPHLVARLEHPGSGRVLELLSDMPGLQLYSGNFLDGTRAGKTGRLYRQGDAVALEPQMFPDTPNQPAFGSIRLDPGEVWQHSIRFRFGTTG